MNRHIQQGLFLRKYLIPFHVHCNKPKRATRQVSLSTISSLTEESGIRQAYIAEHSIKESALHLGSLIAHGCTVRTSRSTHCCCTSHRSIKTSSGTTGFVPVIQQLHKLRVLNDRYNPLLMMLSMLSHEAGPNQQISCVLESRVWRVAGELSKSRNGNRASYINNRTQSCSPNVLAQLPGLATAIAWDNYDGNMETLSGSGSLHDTWYWLPKRTCTGWECFWKWWHWSTLDQPKVDLPYVHSTWSSLY